MTKSSPYDYNPFVKGIYCQNCGQKRRELVCPHCGYVFVFIRFTHDGERFDLFRDRHGNAYTYSQAELDKREIDIQRKVAHNFRAEEWRPQEQDARKFVNVFSAFLDQKGKRLHPGTQHVYDVYYRVHFPPLYDMDVRTIQMKHLQKWYDGLDRVKLKCLSCKQESPYDTGSCPKCGKSLDEEREKTQPLSGKYKKNMTDCLRTFFNWLVRWGDIKTAPVMPDIDSPNSVPRSAIEYEAQQDQLEQIPEPHRDFIEFLMEGGFRPAEGCALKIGDYNPSQGKILVQRGYSRNKLIDTTKANWKDWRTLSTRACELIIQAIGNEIDADRFIFINPATGEGYRPEFTRRLWANHKTVPEDLYASTRHSLGTRLGENGVPTKYIQEILGQRDIRSTQRYVHPSTQKKRDYLDNSKKVIPINRKAK